MEKSIETQNSEERLISDNSVNASYEKKGLLIESEELESFPDNLEKLENIENRIKTLGDFTMLADQAEIPITNETLDWQLFNQDYYSSDR